MKIKHQELDLPRIAFYFFKMFLFTLSFVLEILASPLNLQKLVQQENFRGTITKNDICAYARHFIEHLAFIFR